MRLDTGIRDENRIIIFFSELKKEHLLKTDFLIIDGIFKMVPNQFYQLVTIQGRIFGKFVSLYYILLKNKK